MYVSMIILDTVAFELRKLRKHYFATKIYQYRQRYPIGNISLTLNWTLIFRTQNPNVSLNRYLTYWKCLKIYYCFLLMPKCMHEPLQYREILIQPFHITLYRNIEFGWRWILAKNSLRICARQSIYQTAAAVIRSACIQYAIRWP